MSDASRLPEAVQWHEGMLLTPQHFQQASLRQDMLLQYHLAAVSPYAWGIKRLQLDQGLLVRGTFRITALEAVMPDGLVTLHPLEGQELSLDLAPFEAAMREKPQTVHLVVPVQRTTAAAKGELSRFASVEGAPVADMNSGDGDVRIPRLRPRLRLMIGDEVPQAYVSLPLARLVVREEAISLDSYVPPLLMVTADSALSVRCKDVAAAVRAKALHLVDRVRTPTATTAGQMIADTRAIVAALVADLPPFEALLNSGVSHPFPLYVALCAVVGKLAALSPEMIPPALPAYDHADLWATFERALDFVQRMIDHVHESYMAVPFRMYEGSFSLPLRESWIRKRLVLGIRHRAGATEQDAVTWVQDAIIGAASRVQSIGERRIRGAQREVIDSDEDLNVTPGRGQTLLAVTYDADFITAGEPLVLINRSDLRGDHAPAEVVLFVPVAPSSSSTDSPAASSTSSSSSAATGSSTGRPDGRGGMPFDGAQGRTGGGALPGGSRGIRPMFPGEGE